MIIISNDNSYNNSHIGGPYLINTWFTKNTYICLKKFIYFLFSVARRLTNIIMNYNNNYETLHSDKFCSGLI